jgi:twinkle protein
MWWQEHASTCPVLYGVDKIDITKPLLIVEGHIDRLSCIESGYLNTVSIPHGAADTNWINFNWEWLNNFETIILWADNDEAGQKFIKETTVRIGEDRCKVVTPNDRIETVIKDFWKQYNQDINKTDANNVLLACGKQEVLDLIANANDVPIPDVIKLMECPEFDITKALVLDTGIADLDNYIYGFVEGSLNIWTGKTGSGKSSLLLQSCLNESLNSGYGTFIFSGELTSSQLKTWVISQLAGRCHMIEWDNGINKPKTYTVTNDAKKKIESKYMNDVYVYDSYLIATPEKVLSRMEYMRKKFGIKNYIIDNLMCFELDIAKHGNELNAQKNLIIQFLQFTVRYGAIVHLVAHPRKPNGELAVTEYDILGSSNIPNLAHRIFSLKRVTDEEREKGIPYNAYISILKDRILGVSKKDVGLYYDVPSRRMYGDKDNVDKKYNWDDGSITYNTIKFGENGTLVKPLPRKENIPEFMKEE